MANINYEYLSDINLNDPFFDSLRVDYQEFNSWFIRKSQEEESAFTFYVDGLLNSFLYLKFEEESHHDINPPMPLNHRLKIGTLKIDAHGTKLGERFIKKIFDLATENNINEIYVTVFAKHIGLISLFTTFGFYFYGVKSTLNGDESVYVKRFNNIRDDILLDFPMVKFSGVNKHVLSIYPKFHSKLFPDSILNNESYSLLNDISPTNSIHKMYICAMSGVTNFRGGDIVLIYRTSDGLGLAKYRSVVTSVCTIQEVKNMYDFNDINEYLQYCEPYSIFSEQELRSFFNTKKYPFIIKMVYNLAFKKRVINDYLANSLMIRPSYWGVFSISNDQFLNICRKGEINENLIY